MTWSIHIKAVFSCLRMKHKRTKEVSENILGLHVIHMNKWVPCHTYDGHSLILPHFFFTHSINFSHLFFHSLMNGYSTILSLTHEWVLTHFSGHSNIFASFCYHPFMNEWVPCHTYEISDCFPCYTIQITHMNEWRHVLMPRIWGVSTSLRF